LWSGGTLTIRQGLVLAAIPRSASQTSPRSGFATGGLLRVVGPKQLGRQLVQGRFGYVAARRRPAQDFGSDFALFVRRQGIECVEQFSGGRGDGGSPSKL
jgi:hypothetical protein